MIKLVAVALGLAVAFGAWQPPAKPKRAPSLAAHELAFVRGNDIWIARGDGTAQRRLIRDAYRPAWSWDGMHLAFFRNGDVWSADADGSHQVRLTRRYNGKHMPKWYEDLDNISWCPTAPRITFSDSTPLHMKASDGETYTLWGRSVMDVFTNEPAGGAQYTYFRPTECGAGYPFADNRSPAWSRSGHWLAFARNGDVWVAYFDAENTRDQMTNGALNGKREKTRTWDWTASRVAAPASFDEPTWRVSRENHGVTHVDWSPNERHLVYGITRLEGTGTEEVHVLDLAMNKEDITSGLRVLRDHVLPDGIDPTFTPNGRFVTVSAQTEDGSGMHLWLLGLDGKSKRLLLKDGQEPAWRTLARPR